MKSTLILLLGLLAIPLLAADATGKWKGSFDAQGDSHEISFDLKADGAKLTGSVLGLLDHPLEVQEGKIDGSTISFFVMSEWEGNPIKLVYKGELGTDEIKFTMGTEDGSWSTEINAKRES